LFAVVVLQGQYPAGHFEKQPSANRKKRVPKYVNKDGSDFLKTLNYNRDSCVYEL
jgi:hypothetical protein